MISVGLALVASGLLLMYGLAADSGWTALLAGFIVAGIGIGIANPALAAGALLARAGWAVCILERNDWLGGAIRSAEIPCGTMNSRLRSFSLSPSIIAPSEPIGTRDIDSTPAATTASSRTRRC